MADRIRTQVLEMWALCEISLSQVIAAAYAGSASLADELSVAVISHMAIDQRIATLKRVMEEHDLHHRFPFVIPVLRQLVEVRNVFAHSVQAPTVDHAADEIRFVAFSRSGVRTERFTLSQIEGLLGHARVVHSDLGLIYLYVAPPKKAWHTN